MKNCNRNQTFVKDTATILLTFMLLIVVPHTASAEQLTVDYFFEYPLVETAGEYDRVIMKETPNYGNPGEPLLPARGASILLPYGTDVEDILIIPGERIELEGSYNILPASVPVRLSAEPGSAFPPTPDPEIYASDSPFPESLVEKVNTNSFRGYRILTLKLQPIQYIPSSGKLSYYPDLRVVVETVSSDQSESLLRGFAEDNDEIQARVDNPDIAMTYTAARINGSKGYDLLIITTTSLVSSFEPLKDYHDSTGILTEIRTIDEIGSSDPDDIRDYIKSCYLNDGITYVLIGADDDIIPAKDLYVVAYSGGDIEYNMPGDLYYGCLDGTYNYDDDIYWGEPNDGDFGGDVDLIAEVYVGRAAVGNVIEADRFVNKTLQYLTCGDPYLQKVLLVGEHLGFGGISEYAAGTLDDLVDGCSSYGYTTVGIPSDVYAIDKLYDRDWSGNDWPRSELTTRINSDLHVVNHLGHGSPDYAMKLDNSQVMAYVANTDHCLVYSQTCLAGHFDDFDCWAEYMNIKSDYGAFAVIMNARYGWGDYNSTNGPSQKFNREFWDAIFNPYEDMRELGRANMDSKEDNLYRINEGCMRWCYYEINLFGDPTVRFARLSGIAFDYPNGIPETVTPNQPTTLEVDISETFDATIIPGSAKMHYSIDGADFVATDMVEVSPNHFETELPEIACGSEIEFYFSADEASSGTFTDPRYAPDEIYSAYPVTDVAVLFEDNSETDLGWTVSGDAGDGQWDRGVPVGGGDRGDPPADFDGSGMCYLTDNVDGNSDVDDGTTILISPTIDMSTGDATIHYARWYSNSAGDDPNNDEFLVYISNNDGADWVIVETVGPVAQSSGGWYEYEFQVSDYVSPTSQIKLRFDASDLNYGSVVEAAIDDVYVKRFECQTYIPGDADDSKSVDIDDVVYLIDYVFQSGPEPIPLASGSVDCEGVIDIDDIVYLINYLFMGGKAPCDPNGDGIPDC